MGTLLKWVGMAWAVIGIANIVMMPWDAAGETLLGVGLIFNGGLFVLPGLVVAGIGSGLAKKAEEPTPRPAAPAPRKTTEQRLSELADLKGKGLIDDAEFDTRRASILQDV